MTNDTSQEKIALFKSLFKGREDGFAIRWEKGSKSGYMPAYYYDPFRYRAHKIKGGTFDNYPDKKHLPLTDTELSKHIDGAQHIGMYPMLTDNTSWFIVADFDKKDWLKDCHQFQETCKKHGIPAYLERSRSGNGGHVWIFFDQPYPAIRSRKIIISILEQAGVFSVFDKGSSFDRIFPNQDFLSGKGFGNLIALPLFKKTLVEGKSCFIDPETDLPFADQWEFLKNIKRISATNLNLFYQTLLGSGDHTIPQEKLGKLAIELSNIVEISRNGLPRTLINYLKEELNFANTEFIIKKNSGRNTFGTERYFKLIEETENSIIIPRGFTGKLIRFCRENKIENHFIDNRKKQKEVAYSFTAQLREHQQAAVESTSKKDIGIIVAPPGSGKTILALKIIAEKRQPALIITHRKQIAEQWIERIQTFLGIPKNEIGRIGMGKTKVDKNITVAMIQTLSKELEKAESKELMNAFGLVIIDECHHIPAETFRMAFSKLKSFYSYGLTATPFRKYNGSRLMFIHLGEVIFEIKPDNIKETKNARIIIRHTELDLPFNPKTDKYETLSKILVHDSSRNKLILADVHSELKAGKKAVILTERKEHIDSLYQYLKQSYEAMTLSGDDSEKDRTSKWALLKKGNYQVLITTGQFFGEGTDLQSANCLFLVYPFSFEGKLIQYIGRVQRSEITPTIYDYRDTKIDYLNKMFLKRNVYYRKIGRQATLFDDPPEDELPSNDVFCLDQKIKIPFESLEFRYGSIAFRHLIPELKKELEFDIENLEIRPEFDVLKPYFSKVLKTKHISVEIQAEFENGSIVSQIAKSEDIQKINKEILEGVKFRFITKNLLGNQNNESPIGLLDVSQLQSSKEGKHLYDSGEELLGDLLKNKNYKHRKHLEYLARHHARTILKIRFILNPFSFVFLLTGINHFHIVMETLDTEDATYIWHTENDKRALPAKLRQIDEHLNFIRTKGRQAFLQKVPPNFSRVVHDYLDERKGFIIWKDLLEEQLT
jgi:superfamily II DNA or RNA helicase